ncbi:MAG: dynamin family protein [Bryobacteraceae bacterium]
MIAQFASIHSLAASLRGVPSLQAWADLLHETAERLRLPPTVAVVGEFNAGKSTLLNALLADDVLRMDVLPATAAITVLKFGKQRSARLSKHDGSTSAIELDAVHDFSSETGALDSGDRTTISTVELSLESPLLESVTLVDTPGFNSGSPAHKVATKAWLSHADALVWVFSALQACSAQQLKEIDELGVDGKLFAVVNRIDDLDPDEESEAEILRRCSIALGGRVSGSIVGLSAKTALKAIVCSNEDDLLGSRLPALLELFHEQIVPLARRTLIDRHLPRLAAVISELGKQFAEIETRLVAFCNEALAADALLESACTEAQDWIRVHNGWSCPPATLIRQAANTLLAPASPEQGALTSKIMGCSKELFEFQERVAQLRPRAVELAGATYSLHNRADALAKDVERYNNSGLFGVQLFQSAVAKSLEQRGNDLRQAITAQFRWRKSILDDIDSVVARIRMLEPPFESLRNEILKAVPAEMARSETNAKKANSDRRAAEIGWRTLAWAIETAAKVNSILPELLREVSVCDATRDLVSEISTAIHALDAQTSSLRRLSFPRRTHADLDAVLGSLRKTASIQESALLWSDEVRALADGTDSSGIMAKVPGICTPLFNHRPRRQVVVTACSWTAVVALIVSPFLFVVSPFLFAISNFHPIPARTASALESVAPTERRGEVATSAPALASDSGTEERVTKEIQELESGPASPQQLWSTAERYAIRAEIRKQLGDMTGFYGDHDQAQRLRRATLDLANSSGEPNLSFVTTVIGIIATVSHDENGTLVRISDEGQQHLYEFRVEDGELEGADPQQLTVGDQVRASLYDVWEDHSQPTFRGSLKEYQLRIHGTPIRTLVLPPAPVNSGSYNSSGIMSPGSVQSQTNTGTAVIASADTNGLQRVTGSSTFSYQGWTMPEAISAVLSRWTQTMLAGDIDGQMQCYGRTVERFFGRYNVNWSTLWTMKEAGFSKYPNVNRYQISNVELLNAAKDRVTLTFRKEWNATGVTNFAGASQIVLALGRFGESWKIISETEPKVYWSSR